MTGTSRRVPVPVPFVGSDQLGQEDVINALRKAERDSSMASVVIYVNSSGGSALASDLIWREINRLREKKPVVIYMNEIGASAAYYIAVGGDWIVSQPLTVTGSIGVLFVRLATEGLFKKLKINRVSLQRGAHAGIYSDDKKLNETEYSLIRRHVFDLFERFNSRVTTGRDIGTDQLAEVGEGRVWLGVQALERNLVDQLGDFEDALNKAKDLAGITDEEDVPHVWISPRGGSLLPLPSIAGPTEIVKFFSGFRGELYWLISPFDIHVK